MKIQLLLEFVNDHRDILLWLAQEAYDAIKIYVLYRVLKAGGRPGGDGQR